MRTTVNLDDKLLARAKFLTGIQDTAPLLKAALASIIHQEASRQLARLGGSQPDMQDIPRRRSEPSLEYATYGAEDQKL
jgi:hypothetical protein